MWIYDQNGKIRVHLGIDGDYEQGSLGAISGGCAQLIYYPVEDGATRVGLYQSHLLIGGSNVGTALLGTDLGSGMLQFSAKDGGHVRLDTETGLELDRRSEQLFLGETTRFDLSSGKLVFRGPGFGLAVLKNSKAFWFPR